MEHVRRTLQGYTKDSVSFDSSPQLTSPRISGNFGQMQSAHSVCLIAHFQTITGTTDEVSAFAL